MKPTAPPGWPDDEPAGPLRAEELDEVLALVPVLPGPWRAKFVSIGASKLARLLYELQLLRAEPGRSVSSRPPASESSGPLAALREALLHEVESWEANADAWRGKDAGKVDAYSVCAGVVRLILSRAALRESSAERGGEER